MHPDVDDYIRRSDKWPEVITELRPILLDAGLDEAIKLRSPCYGYDGTNIAIVQEMKQFLALMFFRGRLLSDPDGVLEDQGPNSRSARRIRFTSVDDVQRLEPVVRARIAEAITVEAAGIELPEAPELELVDELRERLDADPVLRAAFESLTPGRQREYDLHVSSAKQTSTRESRIDKCAPRILKGEGLRDR